MALLEQIDFDKLAEYIQGFLKQNESNKGVLSTYDMRMAINTWLVAASGKYQDYREMRDAAEDYPIADSKICMDVLVEMGVFRVRDDNEGGFSPWFVCDWD